MKTFLNFLPEVNILTHDDVFGNNRIVASILRYILSELTVEKSVRPHDEYSDCAISQDTPVVLTPDELSAISNFLYLNMSIDQYNSIFKNQEKDIDKKHEEYKDSFGIEDNV